MDQWQIGNAAYLVLLGAVLVFWFFVQNRQSLGRVAQQAIAWGLIFLGVIAAVGLWGDIRRTVRPSLGTVTGEGAITVPRAPDGHYYLTLAINDRPVEFLVDTGASEMVLSQRDAARVGIDTDDLAYTGQAMTANGVVRTAPVRLDSVSAGPISDRDLRAWVSAGEMPGSLLGMGYLQRWSSVHFQDGTLVLTR
ncbi:retropepsin-like aspartic protease family protein [Pontibaca methylaminivorans]|uniref:Aspartyl protease family protein n=1 Tax=Pontibaca methylaminivorans TaxID=515897 RepID=A0A1R3WYR3_9RHOB|nr:TIGR02281 family clan AA aspartic protease [Pontibaca methylaminivorans]SIT83728.1 aspartyl protease family protein [Pontibaca methylaminivorans]